MVKEGNGRKESLIGCLGLAYAQYCLGNGWSMGTSCIAEGTLPNIL